SVHPVGPTGHGPRAMRPDWPESGPADPRRLDRAGVPDARHEPQGQGQIALELLDRVRGEGGPGQVVVADAGSGAAQDVRDGLHPRGLHDLVGVADEMVVFAEGPTRIVPPWSGRGRRPTRPRRADGSP